MDRYPPTHFQVVRDHLTNQTQRFRFQISGETGNPTEITWQQAIALWQENHTFRHVLTTALAQVPFPAFFWETPPITTSSLHQPWECVVVAAPRLAQVTPNPSPFSHYLMESPQDSITTFPNLGGDAVLVVPTQQGEIETYTHMANFLRLAPRPQVHRLWQVLGQTLQQHCSLESGKPLWVSTSGLGVYWLHVRLDDAPKYYTHTPYRTVP